MSDLTRLDELLDHGPQQATFEEDHAFATLQRELFGTVVAPVMVGRYILLRPAGRGGRGQVFVAFDPRLQRNVALKLVRTSPDRRHRALREARLLAGISHPNVIAVFDADAVTGSDTREPEHYVYLAMELVEGETIAQWLRRQRPRAAPIIDAFIAAGRGLAAAHEAGVAHLDFKPANVMRDPSGRVRLVDFGLANPVSEYEASDGQVAGTPRYMSVEQHCGASVDRRSDQYSYCVALYESLYGVAPFCGDTLTELADAKQRCDLRWPARPRVPAFVKSVLQRGLSPSPSDRFASMAALLDAIEGGRRRRSRVRSGLVIAGVATASALFLDAGDRTAAKCEIDEDPLGDTWKAEFESHIRHALRDDEAGLGRWERARTELDAWVASYTTAQSDACQQPPGRAVAIRRCLDRRREELQAVAAALSDADASTIRYADRAVVSLAPPQSCLSVPDGNPPLSEQVPLEQYARIARARIDHDLGDYQGGLRRLEAGQSQTTPDSVASIQLERIRGLLQAKNGDFDSARLSLQRSWSLAETFEQDAEAGWAIVRLAWVEYSLAGDPELAGTLLRLAGAKERRLGGHPELSAAISTMRGGVAMDGHPDEALEHYRKALSERIATFGTGDRRVAEAHTNVANALDVLGQSETAREHYEAAITIWSRVLDSKHPLVVWTRLDLALNRVGAKAPEAALEQLELVRPVVQPALDHDPARVGMWWHVRGIALVALDRSQEGLAALEKAESIFATEQRLRTRRVEALVDLARSLRAVHRDREAVERIDEALSVIDEHPRLSRSVVQDAILLKDELTAPRG